MKKDLNIFFETLCDNASLAMMVINLNTNKILYLNKLAQVLFEIGDQPLESINYKTILPIASTSNNELNEIKLHKEGFLQNIRVAKFNGSNFIANINIKKLNFNGDDYSLIMFQDLTLQLKLQRDLTFKQQEIEKSFQDLMKQNLQLKELDLAKTRFIALTTHELRTPLSAIVGFSELLKDKLYDSEEQREEFIKMIYEQSHHLMELVNDILDYSKISSGKMDYFIQEQELVEFVKKISEQFQTLSDSNGISLEFNTQQNTMSCFFDEVRLKQILFNILSNAFKYNIKNGKVKVELKEDSEFAYVYVRDTGKGIPKDQIELVFNEFETLGKVANHQKGTGLGMPITKRLIEGMGGQVFLESEVGVGSCFWISIPKNKVLEDSQYRARNDEFDLAAS